MSDTVKSWLRFVVALVAWGLVLRLPDLAGVEISAGEDLIWSGLSVFVFWPVLYLVIVGVRVEFKDEVFQVDQAQAEE